MISQFIKDTYCTYPFWMNALLVLISLSLTVMAYFILVDDTDGVIEFTLLRLWPYYLCLLIFYTPISLSFFVKRKRFLFFKLLGVSFLTVIMGVIISCIIFGSFNPMVVVLATYMSLLIGASVVILHRILLLWKPSLVTNK